MQIGFTPQQNHLLAALPAKYQELLFPDLTLTALPLGKVLYESGSVCHTVYFPVDSVISLLSVMESGASADVSLVGREGLVGTEVLMGSEEVLGRSLVLSAGHAYSLSATRAMREFKDEPALRVLALRHAKFLMTQMAQAAACNRHHTIGQRLSRLLLLSLDRLTVNQLTMTQELIANMLGVRRESVGEAAAKLQQKGIIEYKRGKILVQKRTKLEKTSCECYSAIKRESDRLHAFENRKGSNQ